ncbi:hypothetical protein ABIC89_000409 [Variovorax boronicumulans]|uniref:nuclease domain-containing protein n=1 Tax=Variovorax boronicumulans TaxID=436515 RepID=UPI0033981FE1
MKRSSLKRLELVHKPPTPAKRLERPVVMADCSAMSQPMVKPEPQRNPHLLSMARGRPCLLRVPSVCNYDNTTTVAAHSNLLRHGKGMGTKASDAFTVWACSHCHTWLDSSYDAEFETKESAFMSALIAQVEEWKAIDGSAASSPKDRAAAAWAIKRLQVPA